MSFAPCEIYIACYHIFTKSFAPYTILIPTFELNNEHPFLHISKTSINKKVKVLLKHNGDAFNPKACIPLLYDNSSEQCNCVTYELKLNFCF